MNGLDNIIMELEPNSWILWWEGNGGKDRSKFVYFVKLHAAGIQVALCFHQLWW